MPYGTSSAAIDGESFSVAVRAQIAAVDHVERYFQPESVPHVLEDAFMMEHFERVYVRRSRYRTTSASSGEHVVYRYFNTDETLLYVGVTSAFRSRERAHATGSPWWSLVCRSAVTGFPSRAEAEAAEAEAIVLESPVYNVAGRP